MHEKLREALKKAAQTLGLDTQVNIEHPADISMGDYSTNIAMAAAKKENINPRELAQKIIDVFEKPEGVERIEIAGSGFINFYLSRDFFTKATQDIVQAGDTWGKNSTLVGKRIMVEYTDPNLFKPLHIGHLMSNTIGEAIARLIEACAADIKRANYPSDIGLTVAKGVWGLQKTGGDPTDIHALGESYRVGHSAYEDDEVAKKEIEAINKALYEDIDPTLSKLREEGIKTSLEHLDALCKILGTSFDFVFFESQSGQVGKDLVYAALEKGLFEESDGAIVFRGEKYDPSLHTRVFINSQGLPTYEAKDLGLVELKRQQFPFDLSISITSVEQHEYFRVIIVAITQVFPEFTGKILHIDHGFLTLSTGKMSSRKGNVITGESLIEDMRAKVHEKMEGRDLGEEREEIADAVAVAAIKYQILKQKTGKNIVFDPEKSLSFEGDSGPYLQYAHTRALSILRKAVREGVVADISLAPETITEVEKLLYRFPEVVERAMKDYEPHYVTTYLTELSSAFNTWYAQEQIVSMEDQYSPYKVALTRGFAQTMKNGLWLLGIKAPEKM